MLAASFGGLILLGIVIYITTDKGRVKIDVGEPKAPVHVAVEQDGKKTADITIEPSPAPAASRPVEPPSEPTPQASPKVAAEPPSSPAPAQEWVSPFTQMKFAVIPDGSFEMGSEDGAGAEKPRHRVTISRPFYMGVCEVTQGEYERLMGTNPSLFSKTGLFKERVRGEDTDRLPVETVTWFDAVKCCNELSRKDGLAPFYTIAGEGDGTQVTVPDWNGTGYRLPTEAEWEYACRAGSKTEYSFGGGAAALGKYAWFGEGFSTGKTHPVGGKPANAWGLHDMHGNVYEWCWDWYDEGHYKKESSNIDPKGPESGDARVWRGGGWFDDATNLRSTYRSGLAPALRSPFGLRCVRTYH